MLLDSRVVRKHSGQILFDSLRAARRMIGERPAVYAALRELYSRD